MRLSYKHLRYIALASPQGQWSLDRAPLAWARGVVGNVYGEAGAGELNSEDFRRVGSGLGARVKICRFGT